METFNIDYNEGLIPIYWIETAYSPENCRAYLSSAMTATRKDKSGTLAIVEKHCKWFGKKTSI